MARDINQSVEQLMAHTGLRAKLEAEQEQKRITAVSAARAAKKAAIARFLDLKPKALERRDAAEAQRKAAAKAAEDAIAAEIKANEYFSQIHGELAATTDPLDRILRDNADPRIDEFEAELRAMRAAAPGEYRSWPDDDGPILGLGGQRVRDNSSQVNARVRVISNILNSFYLLKVSPDIEDVGAEIDRLRKSIPSVE